MADVVGVVGLGIMGGAMARNLVTSGWKVFGYDTDTTRRAELEADGITLCDSVAALAAETPFIMTSLPSVKAVQATALAIAATGLPPRIVMEASTLALADKLAFAEVLTSAGHIPLDCPVSGTGSQAAAKDLVIYASGDSAAIEAVRPCYAAFTRALHDVGVYGNGTRMKLVANLLVAIHNVATAEAMVLGMKAGLDPAQMSHLIAAGAGNSRIFELRAPMMAADTYLPATMKVDIWQKDMDVIGAFATELGVPTPTFNATMPIYAAARAQGLGAQDTAAVCAVLERMAGIARTPG
jgi:3-hydroxyisobutyrate dehydrogenase-like beta-hydroxyacid dehydrogenase